MYDPDDPLYGVEHEVMNLLKCAHDSLQAGVLRGNDADRMHHLRQDTEQISKILLEQFQHIGLRIGPDATALIGFCIAQLLS